jgi:uncharacterized protein YceH (UPF0502 family)
MMLTDNGKRGDGGAYTYNQGWNDQRVRDELKVEHAKVEKIAEMRREHCGLLPDELVKEAAAAAGADLKARIKLLEETVAKLTARLAECEPIINALK